jgi:REP element-mobilizing transposase RayT
MAALARASAGELYRALAARDPEPFNAVLAQSLNLLGVRLNDIGEPEAGGTAAREALEIYRALESRQSGTFLREVGSNLRSRKPEQLPLFKPHGGKRRGAGRPPKGKRAGAPHKARPFLHERYPVHVTLRVVSAVGKLRRRRMYQAVREATLTTARREDFRIVHLSIQRDHIHMLVEAKDKEALAKGMQGFQISAAKHLNAAISKGKPGPRRRGSVFSDRYHAKIITSPTQARHTLSYVMNNWRKHQEDRHAPMSDWTIDWFSSAIMFPGWSEYGDTAFFWRWPDT